MTQSGSGELSLKEAVAAFENLPPELQLSSLHPEMAAIDANKSALLKAVYWRFAGDDRFVLHSFQLGENPGLKLRDIQSAYGYGGPLANSDDPQFIAEADQAFRRWAHEHSVVAEFLRFHPLVPHGKWYPGDAVTNRETVCIDLGGDLFKQYAGRRRTDIRRFAGSGIVVKRVSPETMRAVFPEFYKSNMEKIGATDGYFFPQIYFDALCHFNGAENWLAYADERAVAGAITLVSKNARVAEYHLGAKAEDADQKAMVGLLHAAAEFYQAEGFRHFYLGGGRSVAANDSLLFFKKGFSPLTRPFQTGARIFDAGEYAKLKTMMPAKAATGRVLFYKD